MSGSQVSPSEERAKLGFTPVARRTFGFLMEAGFKCVRAEPTLVRYESNDVFINVYHDSSSYELSMEVGPLDFAQKGLSGYSMSALIRLVDPSEANRYRDFCALTLETVKIGLAQLVDAFMRYGAGIVQHDLSIFDKLAKQRVRMAKVMARETKLRQVRPLAEAAFHSRQYAEAARLYESIERDLTQTELKKLEYARSHKK